MSANILAAWELTRDTVARSAKFRTWVSAADETAAKTKIFPGDVSDTTNPPPRAVVYRPAARLEKTDSSNAMSIREMTAMLALEYYTASSGYEHDDFWSDVATIVDQMSDEVNIAGRAVVPQIDVQLMGKTPKELNNGQEWYLALLEIYFGGRP